ncbi:alpha/beta hydrolase [Frankia sp. CNm7]|uniref:Alpha/beta hydrolase n=1 Tax=Frankia nepalensis TaxID=1836974 RepID=A0A937UV58_9ACTN|nr:alpha/beta hydrolase [Frankia nepalensis]MBL7497289.1 alpha/beta hydrolase [Frankia nepalensis]MBL7515476.1 alpha/beta hydrolase [Frankia nepalensis]MBL7522782.1 alpha/beta hydrolase [Frankia nepalensis]MBL7631906.1 alpha/beta hydrolase [Frankia nepalensis]
MADRSPAAVRTSYASVDGLRIAYQLIGDDRGDGRLWVITTGGRFTKETPGVRALAEALAVDGDRVLVWDRPNCGESDVRFAGETEPEMQADALAALLAHLDLGPAVLAGATVGTRVSLLTAARHPEVAAGLALWWLSGGPMGLMILGNVYYTASITAAWTRDMAAVADLPDWAGSIAGNPANRQRILDQDRDEFLATLQRWMQAYCPRPAEQVPGLSDDAARAITVPTLVFRGGASDPFHPRLTSEAVAALLPNASLVEPPWGDREYLERQAEAQTAGGLFVRWPLLAPTLRKWAAEALGG